VAAIVSRSPPSLPPLLSLSAETLPRIPRRQVDRRGRNANGRGGTPRELIYHRDDVSILSARCRRAPAQTREINHYGVTPTPTRLKVPHAVSARRCCPRLVLSLSLALLLTLSLPSLLHVFSPLFFFFFYTLFLPNDGGKVHKKLYYQLLLSKFTDSSRD